MILIVGLGNPGEKYAYNRHNAGFMFVDYLYKALLRSKEESPQGEVVHQFTYDKYSHSETTKIGLTTHNSPPTTLFLAKPQTFMNRSGEAVKKLCATHNLQPTTHNLFIAHDDLDLELGKYKIQLGTGPKVHNGISSIEDTLGTKDFWRIRIGVDSRAGDRSMPGDAYVLQNFNAEEKKIFEAALRAIYNTVISKL